VEPQMGRIDYILSESLIVAWKYSVVNKVLKLSVFLLHNSGKAVRKIKELV
jgi:hypothetical protein